MRILIIFASLLIITVNCSQLNKPVPSGFIEPPNPESIDKNIWNKVPEGLHAGFGTPDSRYERDTPPQQDLSESWNATGWKGERLHTQLILWNNEKQGKIDWTFSDLIKDNGQIIPRSAMAAKAVRFVLGDEFLTGCGYRDPDTIPSYLIGDILEPVDSLMLDARTSRPIWISLNIPPDTEKGSYIGKITIHNGELSREYTISINVQDHKLPSSEQWKFHLDLWQNPYAVARVHDIPLWSETHWEHIKQLLILLADAGQKCITTSIVQEPWGGQTYDPFGSMIGWIRNSSGKWQYDYSIFDQYVQLAMDCGIRKQINCYAMVPWGNQVGWFDEDSAGFVGTTLIPGSSEYEEFWRPFLEDFRAHLKEKGWLELTTLALDERNQEEMEALFDFVNRTAPEFKITMAGHYFEDINELIHDYSYNWSHISENASDQIQRRRSNGQVTTYYVACGIRQPNTFTFSPPAEATWLGWYASALGFDGFLRWAYNSWVKDPLMDTRFRSWPSGDTYLVYPGPRSSIRFERLREGIQDCEKIRILMNPVRSGGISLPDSLNIDLFLSEFNKRQLWEKGASEMVNEGKSILKQLSDYLTND